MKKFVFTICMFIAGFSVVNAQIPEQLIEQKQDWTTTENDSLVSNPVEQPQPVNILFDKYILTAPSNLIINSDTNSPAVIYKAADGSLGISVQVDTDKKVGEKGALKLCNAMAKGFKLADAKASKVNIHGLHGATVAGMLEGRAINIAVLSDGNKYIKVVVMSVPSLSAEGREIIYSIRRLK